MCSPNHLITLSLPRRTLDVRLYYQVVLLHQGFLRNLHTVKMLLVQALALRTDVLEMKDLKEGMVLKGTVRNVIDFGAFVDIGVHQDGLVHISQMTDRYIKHPLEVVSVGDIIDVQVMSVDLNKKRIQLTMKIDHNK